MCNKLIFISNTIDEYYRTDKEQPMKCIFYVFNKTWVNRLCMKAPSDCTVDVQAIVQSINISDIEKRNIFEMVL